MDDIVFALRDTIGEVKLRRFIEVLNRQCRSMGRLYYWQEQELQKLAATKPQYSHLTFAEVLDRFAICHLHGVSLVSGERAIETYPPYTSDGFNAKEELEWPYAYLVMYVKLGQKIRHDDYKVLYCPSCRAALIDWNRGRTRKYGVPQAFQVPTLEVS